MILDLQKVDLTQFLFQDWLILLYYGTIAPTLVFVLWFKGVSRVSGSIAGVFSAILPISTMVFSAFLLGEALTIYHGIGTVFIIAGIYFIIQKDAEKNTKSLIG